MTLLEATNDVGGHAKTWVDKDRGVGPVSESDAGMRAGMPLVLKSSELEVGGMSMV